MGFLGSVVSWVEHAAEDAWDGVKDGANWVEHKVEGAVHEVEDDAKKAVHWAEDAVGDAWAWTKDEAHRVEEAGEDIFEGVKEGGKAILSDFGEGAAHIGKGLVKIVEGDFKGGAKEIGAGTAQATVGGIVDAGALIGAGVISGVQVAGHIEQVKRSLSPDEIAVLQGIYGKAVDFSQVQIVEGSAGLLTAANRPWTSGDTIFMDMDKSDPRWMETLVHEMGHVWQFQNGGPDYQSKSLAAQYVTKDAYQWESAAREEKPWESLNPEDQAELIQQMYRAGFFSTGKFVFTASDGSTVDRTAYAEKIRDQVLRGIGAP